MDVLLKSATRENPSLESLADMRRMEVSTLRAFLAQTGFPATRRSENLASFRPNSST